MAPREKSKETHCSKPSVALSHGGCGAAAGKVQVLQRGEAATSPDLNVIENYWALLKRKVRAEAPRSQGELEAAIQRAVEGIAKRITNNLCVSFKSRLRECVKGSGATILTERLTPKSEKKSASQAPQELRVCMGAVQDSRVRNGGEGWVGAGAVRG